MNAWAPRTGLLLVRGALVVVTLSLGGVGCSCGGAGTLWDAGDVDAASLYDAPTDLLDGDLDATVTGCQRAAQTGDPLGCDYYVWYGFYAQLGGSIACMAVLVSNPGDAPARLDVEWRGKALDPAQFGRIVVGQGTPPTYAPLTNATLPAHGSAILALVQGQITLADPSIETCPFGAAFTGNNASSYGDTGDSFRLRSTEPVFVAHVYPFNQAWSIRDVTTTSLRSTESWDLRYLDIGAFRAGRPPMLEGGVETDSGFQSYSLPTWPAFTAVVAATAGKVTLAREGGTTSFNLAAGQPLTLGQDDLFIGTPITADRPVGVFTGLPALQLPWNAPGWTDANWVFHQFAPPSAWGSTYAAVRPPDRYQGVDDPIVWRLLGSTDGTMLAYEPSPPPQAPGTLAAGQQVVFAASKPFIVRSQDAQHAFHLSALMTSCTVVCPANCQTDCRGGPQLVSVAPPEEYANRYAFVTEPTFPDTWLVVVRMRSAGTFQDVRLDCAGTLDGWQPLDSDFQYTHIALSRGNFQPQSYDGGACANGAHTMESTGLFGVTVWGWGSDAPGFEREVIGTSYAIVPFGSGPRPVRAPPGQR